MHYCKAHKYSTETVINASRLINKLLYLDNVIAHIMYRSRLARAANLLLKDCIF